MIILIVLFSIFLVVDFFEAILLMKIIRRLNNRITDLENIVYM